MSKWQIINFNETIQKCNIKCNNVNVIIRDKDVGTNYNIYEYVLNYFSL